MNPNRSYLSVCWSILRSFVTVCLKLPNSLSQYSLHLPVSMHPSQGLYGGIGATVINRCYVLVLLLAPHSLKSLTHTHTHTQTHTHT